MFQPLLAIGDLLGLLIWIAIITISILSKVRGNPQKPPPLQPPKDVPQQPARPIQAGKPGGRTIELEIEEFLRDIRGQRPEPPPEVVAAPPPPPTKRLIEATSVEPPPRKEIVPGQGFGRDVSDHVSEHIVRDSISTRDARLGDIVEQADERVEDRLQSVFDHEVGHLAHVEDTGMDVHEGTDAAVWENKTSLENATATQIRELLQTPESIRNVFVISEILKRPDI